MTFMRKFLDKINIENCKGSNSTKNNESCDSYANKYEEYYNRINKGKLNNLNISFGDVEIYDMKPFDLKKEFITDGNFTAIQLEGKNLSISYKILQSINKLLKPYNKYFDKPLPTEITTDFLFNRKLPHSHLRLNPYTHSFEDNEFPLLLWLSYFGDYGNDYLYQIYFEQTGQIGKCDLQLYNYTIQIKKENGDLYVGEISKTLKEPPYGTVTLYSDKKNNL